MSTEFRFRSYRARDESLAAAAESPDAPSSAAATVQRDSKERGDLSGLSVGRAVQTVRFHAATSDEGGSAKSKLSAAELIAKRSVDWDLKRDVQRKIKVLDVRTRRALDELLEEKLADEEDSSSDEESSQ